MHMLGALAAVVLTFALHGQIVLYGGSSSSSSRVGSLYRMRLKAIFLRRYRETVPDAKVVILAGSPGHYPQVESPRAVLKAYFAFLKQLGYTNF